MAVTKSGSELKWSDIQIDTDILPDLSGNSLVVLEKRYLEKDAQGNVAEAPGEMFRRIARFTASADFKYGKSVEEVNRTATRFYTMMANLEFIPNSPTLMNAGRPLGQLAACFVLPVGDSMEGIFDAIKNMALIHKSGGGTGFSFSRLRPKNDMVRSTTGISSGPVSFMKIFNTATETVKQGGTRRGANMAILNVDHPDILEFITAKEDTSTLTNFNCSVALTDAFMKAVEENGEYDIINPRTNLPVSKLNAREVFSLIVKKAWQNGEPGIVFIDRINDRNPLKKVGAIESTNPCVAGDTWVHTANGPRRAVDLLGTPFAARIDGRDFYSGKQGFFKTATRNLLRIETEEGYTLRLTDNHPVRSAKRISRYGLESAWKNAGELRPGDRVILNDHRENFSWPGEGSGGEGYLVGLLFGDGTLKKDKAVISVWMEDGCEGILEDGLKAAMALPHRSDFGGWVKIDERNEYRMALGHIKNLLGEFGVLPGNKAVTDAIEKASSAFYAGFLRGFFDADGSIKGSLLKGMSVRLSQSDPDMLEAVQRMLLRLGIASKIYRERRKKGFSFLPDGKGGRKPYPTRAQHELAVSGENLFRFAEVIGFSHRKKMARLASALKAYSRRPNRERFIARIRQVSLDQHEDVFDAQVPGANTFDANGIKVHNCGEQPLLPYESCNLGSINLVKALARTNGKYELDLIRLAELTRDAVHFLDNIIDLNRYPLPEIRETTLASRKIGLGIMGFADALIRLGIPYDSDEALAAAEEIMSVIQNESRKASRELAAERGPFPLFEKSEYAAGGEAPLRNSTTTTIAPTGTISIIAGTTSGIEPIFALAFVRNVMDNHSLVEVNPLFEEVARERGFYSEALMDAVAKNGSVAHIAEVPDDVKRVFVTAHDISPESHIRMQAVFQKHVDNAVSKTVNFPNSATESDIEKVYTLAYRLGCKGVTVYRDGSRENQVLEVKREKGAVSGERIPAPGEFLTPRPREEVTRGTTRKMTTGCGSLYVTINEDDAGLFEVFATMGKSGGCAASQTESVSRLISLSLRCGIEPEQIIKQLKGVRCPNQAWEKGGRIYSCADAIAKALERHLGLDTRKTANSGDEAKNNAETNGKGSDTVMVGVCPDCHGPLEFESGCSVCRMCGFSRCG